MIGAFDMPWTAREHELVCAILRTDRVLRRDRAGLPEERVAAARLFVTEFLNWYAGISADLALDAYRAGYLTVKSAQSAGIVPPEAHWRCARRLAGVVCGAPELSGAGARIASQRLSK
ncbi:hypothetical protein ABID58_000685 [Bradyrhizobium sp. S3.2.6]